MTNWRETRWFRPHHFVMFMCLWEAVSADEVAVDSCNMGNVPSFGTILSQSCVHTSCQARCNGLCNVKDPFHFRSVFIERFDCSTHRSTMPVLRTASERLQNVMISWAMEWSDTGETMLTFVELWNKRSRTCVAIEFARWIVWKRSDLLSIRWTAGAYVFPPFKKKKGSSVHSVRTER